MPAARRSLLVLAVALGLALATAVTPAGAAQAQRVRTTISMKQWVLDHDSLTYKVPGTVRSPRAVCERGRTVKLVGPDVRRKTRSDKAGRWSVRIPARPTGGTYRAIAPRKKVRKKGRTIICARDSVVVVTAGA